MTLQNRHNSNVFCREYVYAERKKWHRRRRKIVGRHGEEEEAMLMRAATANTAANLKKALDISMHNINALKQ